MTAALFVLCALSAALGTRASAQPPRKVIFSPPTQPVLEKSLADLYGLNYDQANAGFREIITLEPDNPFSYLVEAASLWWESANEYGVDRRLSAREKVFVQDINACVAKARPLLSSPDPALQADGHFVTGMALGMRGQWEMLKGHWFSAYLDGKKGVKHLQACVRLDPDYDDAYLGLGVYDYQVAHYKRVLKLGFLLGAHGNEERGIGLIRLAQEKGRLSSEQAAMFLITIYVMDRGDAARAAPLVKSLTERFPESLYFKTLQAFLDHSLGRDQEALAKAREAFAPIEKNPAALNRQLLSLACGIAQKTCFNRAYAQKAADWFDLALSSQAAVAGARSPQWDAFARLYRGYAEDILGRRPDAQTDYQWVFAHADAPQERERAALCLSRPCKTREVFDSLRSLASQPESSPIVP